MKIHLLCIVVEQRDVLLTLKLVVTLLLYAIITTLKIIENPKYVTHNCKYLAFTNAFSVDAGMFQKLISANSKFCNSYYTFQIIVDLPYI